VASFWSTLNQVSGSSPPLGVEGRHAVFAAALEQGSVGAGGKGAQAVELLLLEVGDPGAEEQEVGHGVVAGQGPQALGTVGKDPGRGKPVGAVLTDGLGGDFFGAAQCLHGVPKCSGALGHGVV
jgi:hypothetical protein